MRLHARLTVLLLPLLLAACSDGPGPATHIVLVTFDTTRADRLGCYGNESGLTPNLDRFASGATVFEQAVAQTPTTLPSHATILTGVYPQDHGVRYNLIYRLSPEALTLAERLQAAGFATAAFPATYILDRKFGLDQGFETFADPPAFPKGARGHPDDVLRPAEEGVDLALDWLAGQRGKKAFVWLHFYEPHHPYSPPFPYSAEYRARPYDGEIAYADEQFGRLFDRLREEEAWDRTLLVVVGDHGEGLHDHSEAYHAYLVYETTQHVPLIVRAPRARAGRVSEPVVLADLVPTIVDLAGLPVPDGLRGISLRPAFSGKALPRRDLYFESLSGALNFGWAELKGIRSGRWKLIDSFDPELYDLEADPGEQVNLAGLEPERVEDLRVELRALADPLETVVAAEQAQDPVLDAETQLFLASLGYVGSVTGGGSAEEPVHPRDAIDMSVELLSAQRAVAEKRWDPVLELGRYVLERDPGNKWALNASVTALVALGRPVEAQDIGAEFVRLYPDNERAYIQLAIAYQAQQESESAYDVLKQGLRAVPDSEALVYYSVVAAFEARHESVCESELRDALAVHPGSGRLLVLRARCEAEGGAPETALATLHEAHEVGFHEFKLLERAEEFRDVVALQGWQPLVAAGEAAAEQKR
jgi:arylsulfatase A-like enzyme